MVAAPRRCNIILNYNMKFKKVHLSPMSCRSELVRDRSRRVVDNFS